MPYGSDPATFGSGYRGDFAYAHQAGHSDFVRTATPTILGHLRATAASASCVQR